MIIRIVIALGIIYLAYRAGKYIFKPPDDTRRVSPRGSGEITGEDLVKDPQCGTYVPQSTAVTAVIEGEKHYFCSEECRDRYRKARGGN